MPERDFLKMKPLCFNREVCRPPAKMVGAIGLARLWRVRRRPRRTSLRLPDPRLNGRGDRIRTYDLLVPNQALYQTKLHPVLKGEGHGPLRGLSTHCWDEIDDRAEGL